MPTHLGGDCEQTPFALARPKSRSRKEARSLRALTERPACFEIDPRRRAVKRAYRIWVSAAAHHCVQRRIDLLFTMSDNLHRVIEDRRDTNSSSWTSCVLARAVEARSASTSGLPSRSRGKRQRLVEPDGIEPTTSCLQSTRSPN